MLEEQGVADAVSMETGDACDGCDGCCLWMLLLGNARRIVKIY